MATVTVIVQITSIGVDAGPFSITDNLNSFLLTGISRTQLLGGYSITADTTSTSLIVTSTGVCTTSITIPIDVKPCGGPTPPPPPPPPCDCTYYNIVTTLHDIDSSTGNTHPNWNGAVWVRYYDCITREPLDTYYDAADNYYHAICNNNLADTPYLYYHIDDVPTTVGITSTITDSTDCCTANSYVGNYFLCTGLNHCTESPGNIVVTFPTGYTPSYSQYYRVYDPFVGQTVAVRFYTSTITEPSDVYSSDLNQYPSCVDACLDLPIVCYQYYNNSASLTIVSYTDCGGIFRNDQLVLASEQICAQAGSVITISGDPLTTTESTCLY